MTKEFNKIKPVTDLSQKVVRLARAIDRLQPGRHVIILEKPCNGDSWKVSIDRTDRERDMEI